MEWVADWIALPYAERGRGPAYDCLGLFLALQRARMALVLPDPACTVAEAIRRRVIANHLPTWRRVEVPQEGDALLFRIGGRVAHVAYAVSARDMLHTHESSRQSTLDRIRGFTWGPLLEGAYRYTHAP